MNNCTVGMSSKDYKDRVQTLADGIVKCTFGEAFTKVYRNPNGALLPVINLFMSKFVTLIQCVFSMFP